MYDEDDSVEMSLLDEDDRRQASAGILDRPEEEHVTDLKKPMSAKDKRAMVLLCVLCEFTELVSALGLIVSRFDSRSAGMTCPPISNIAFAHKVAFMHSWDWL